MDELDRAILEQLKINARATASQISKDVGLSVPAVAERIRKLEQSRVIRQYVPKLDREALGYHLTAFLLVNLSASEQIAGFRDQVIGFPQVLECHHVAGQYDYLLKVVTRTASELEDFLTHQLKQIEGVISSNTIICLSTLKDEVNP